MPTDMRTAKMVRVYRHGGVQDAPEEWYFNAAYGTSSDPGTPIPTDPLPVSVVQARAAGSTVQKTITAVLDTPPTKGNVLLCSVSTAGNAGAFIIPPGWEQVSTAVGNSVSGILLRRDATGGELSAEGTTSEQSLTVNWTNAVAGNYFFTEIAAPGSKLAAAYYFPNPLSDADVLTLTGDAGLAALSGFSLAAVHVPDGAAAGWTKTSYPTFSGGYQRVLVTASGTGATTGATTHAFKPLAAGDSTAVTVGNQLAEQSMLFVARFSAGANVELSWSVPDAGGAPLTSIVVQRRTYSSTDVPGSWTTIAQLPGDAVSYADSSVVPGTKYGYQVAASNFDSTKPGTGLGAYSTEIVVGPQGTGAPLGAAGYGGGYASGYGVASS